MAKKAALKDTPTGDSLTAEEQKYFTDGGETGIEPEGSKTEPAENSSATSTQSDEPADLGEAGIKPEGNEPQKQKMVPHAALHEAREQAKEYKARVKKLEEDQATLLSRTDELLNHIVRDPKAQEKAQEENAPNPAEDPIGYLTWASKTLAERQEQTDRYIAQQADQQRQYEALGQLQNEAVSAESEFRSENPDYDAAANFVQQSRMNELLAMGYNHPQAAQQMKVEAIGLAARAKQMGHNPAKLIYDMAHARGYKLTSNGSTSESQNREPESNSEMTSQERLKTVNAGQRQAKSLSQAHGTAPTGMTAQRLMEMSDAEFDNFRRKSPAEFRNLMGS